jgi:glycosyltransferase involved in cell wall biosynthesis
MRILMVTRETSDDKRYGLGQSLAPLIAELKHRNIDIDYICQADLGPRALLWQGKLQQLTHKILGKLDCRTDFSMLICVVLERFNMGRLAAKACSKMHYTHIHCHDPIIAAGYCFFSLFSSPPMTKWGVTEHGFGSYSQAIYADGVRLGPCVLPLLCKWEALILNHAAWVIAPSYSAMSRLTEDLNQQSIPGTWHTVYHARPNINRYQKQTARHQLNWSDEIFYIVSVGRIAPVKQFPLLIEACAKAANTESIQLVILGQGEYEPLQKLGEQLKLQRNVQFACANDIGLYLSAADLYISTSASESFGLANLEAMAAGAPAICTAVGAVPEIVDAGGMLVEANLDAVTAALHYLINNENARQTLAERGLQRTQSWPDIKTIADQYEEIYQ